MEKTRTPPSASAAGTGSLMKAIDVLDTIAAATEPLSVAQIASEVGLPRPTTHRILSALLQRGMVRREDQRDGFSLGYRLFELAHRAWSAVDVRGAATNALDRLRDLSQEVVVLGVRKNGQFVCVDRRDSPFNIRPAISVGYSEQLWSSALGMAIVSEFWLSDDDGGVRDEFAELFSRSGHSKALAEIPLNVARGYALMFDDATGTASVAAPILDTMGRPIASIGIIGPASRLSEERLHQLALYVIEATRQTTSNAGNVVQSIAPQPKPHKGKGHDVDVVAHTRTLMGKAPAWHPRNGGELSLSDAFGPSLIRISLADGAVQEVPRGMPEMLAGLTKDGDPVIVNAEGVSVVEPGVQRLAVPLPGTITRLRCNHATPDREGRLVLSMMDARGRTDGGGLYRLEADGSLTTLHAPLTMWSGLDWSPDGRFLYCADTAHQQLLRYRYEGGAVIGDRTVLATFPVSSGRPDGLAIDSSGAIWLAMWDGWRVIKVTPAGKVDQEIVLPIPRPVGLSFGGTDHRTLFITSARVRLSPDVIADSPLSGAVLALRTNTAGIVKPRFSPPTKS